MLPSEPDGLVQGERAVPRLRSDLRNSTAAGHTSGQDQICVGDIFFHALELVLQVDEIAVGL